MTRKLVSSDLNSMLSIVGEHFVTTTSEMSDHNKRIFDFKLSKNILNSQYTFYGKFDETNNLLSFVAFKEWPSKTIMSILDVWVSKREMVVNGGLYPNYVFDMINAGITDSFDTDHTSFYVLHHMKNTEYFIFDDNRCQLALDSFERSSVEVVGENNMSKSSIFTAYLDIDDGFNDGATHRSPTEDMDRMNVQGLMLNGNENLFNDVLEIISYHHVPKTTA